MAYTPNLPIPIMDAASPQAQTLDYNEAAFLIDALLPAVVVSDALATPPASPVAGACYIVAASATGAWAGWEKSIAAYIGGAWVQIAPQEGWVFWVVSNSGRSAYVSGAWAKLIEEAPSDGTAYARKDGGWSKVGVAGSVYDLEFSFQGTPVSSQIIGLRTVGRQVQLGAGLEFSSGNVGATPSSPFIIDVQDDGVSIGVISIAISGVFTFTSASGLVVNIQSGSRLTLVAPATVDATISDISVSLFGTSDGTGFIAAVPVSTYPPSVFSGAADGVVLDASVLASLFKDTAGTIPVTADGDKVALWLDQSGYGTHYTQADLALRPTYRTGGGKPYLDFPGAAYMDSALGKMNFANISYHTGLTSTAINTVPFDCPHVPGSAVSPYRRWGVWHDSLNRAVIMPNGVSTTIGTSPGWQSSAIHFGFDSVAGEVYKNGLVLGTFPSVVISYPNVTHARIGASGWGVDFSTLKVYGVLAADKGFSAADVANVNAWLQSLMY